VVCAVLIIAIIFNCLIVQYNSNCAACNWV